MSCCAEWTPGSYDDAWVIRSALQRVAAVHQLCPLYAGVGAPLKEAQLVDVLTWAGVWVAKYDFKDARPAFAQAVCGQQALALNEAVPRAVREHALRHVLYRAVAGELVSAAGECVHLPGRDWTSPQERAADLFALADGVPEHELERARYPAARLRKRLAVLAPYGPQPEAWLADRLALRLALARAVGTRAPDWQ